MSELEPEKIPVGPQTSVIVVIITLLLGGASAALGLMAMVSLTKNPPTDPLANLGHVLQCDFQTAISKLFAMGAGALLVFCFVLISILGGCTCCCTLTYAWGNAQIVSIICSLFAWLLFLVAEICFWVSAYMNDYYYGSTNFMYDFQLRKCYRTKPVALMVGSVCALFCALFSVLFYGQAQKSKYEAWVEQGAPTPRIYSLETSKSFVIAGPAKKGPLKADEEEGDEEEEEEEDDVFDETEPLRNPQHQGSVHDDRSSMASGY